VYVDDAVEGGATQAAEPSPISSLANNRKLLKDLATLFHHVCMNFAYLETYANIQIKHNHTN